LADIDVSTSQSAASDEAAQKGELTMSLPEILDLAS
jgi:hypothetical protein